MLTMATVRFEVMEKANSALLEVNDRVTHNVTEKLDKIEKCLERINLKVSTAVDRIDKIESKMEPMM